MSRSPSPPLDRSLIATASDTKGEEISLEENIDLVVKPIKTVRFTDDTIFHEKPSGKIAELTDEDCELVDDDFLKELNLEENSLEGLDITDNTESKTPDPSFRNASSPTLETIFKIHTK